MGVRGNSILRLLDYWCGVPVCFLTAGLRKFRQAAPPVSPEKICVICQSAIGDLLLLSSLIKALHNKFPQARIDLIVSEANAQAAELLPFINSIHVFPIRRPEKAIIHLRREKYPLLIDSTQWARLGAIISNCSGSAYTIGFVSKGQHRHMGYDKCVPHSSSMHEVDNFLALGKSLWPDMHGGCILNMNKLVEDRHPLHSGGGRPWICLHMWPSGTRKHLKEWPSQYWVELAEKILAAGYEVFLTGSEADRKKTKEFLIRNFKKESRIFSIAGKYNLVETARIIQKASALVSVNTGIMHLGALLGTATIGLHGPTNPLRWGPVGKRVIPLLPRKGKNAFLNFGFEYPVNYASNMEHLPVGDVLDALLELGVPL